jgi:hypothetical protein
MSSKEASSQSSGEENLKLGPLAGKLTVIGGIVGVVGLVIGALLGQMEGDGFRHYQFSFLVAFWWGLTIVLGGLFFVTLQHLTRAKWSVAVRRVAEVFASTIPLFAVLSLIFVIPVLMGNGVEYPWADHAIVEADHNLHKKSWYLNVGFFIGRMIFYFVIWFLFSNMYLRRSVKQDTSGEPNLTLKLWPVSAPGMILFAITISFCAIDLIMSLEPAWFSTIFGVYIFSGAVQAIYSTMALTFLFLQSRGRLTESITPDHYHDLGKMMFAFVVFWAYIAFSQFMLIWYANIPEETFWYIQRTVNAQTGENVWLGLAWFLVVANFGIPFFGLMSRHVKRNRKALAFWAIWLLVMHYLDLYWLIMPAYTTEEIPWSVMDIANWIGVFGLFVAASAFHARKLNLRPTKDPRLAESLAFENI